MFCRLSCGEDLLIDQGQSSGAIPDQAGNAQVGAADIGAYELPNQLGTVENFVATNAQNGDIKLSWDPYCDQNADRLEIRAIGVTGYDVTITNLAQDEHTVIGGPRAFTEFEIFAVKGGTISPSAFTMGRATPDARAEGDVQNAFALGLPNVPVCAKPIDPAEASAVVLDGSQAFVDVGGAAEAAAGKSAFSIDFWMRGDKTAQPGARRALFAINGASGNNKLIVFFGTSSTGANSGVLSLLNGNTSFTTVPGSTDLGDNEWHHIALVLDAGTYHVYADGVLEASIAADQPNTSDDTWSIGQEFDGVAASSDFFNGLIDEWRLWESSGPRSRMARLGQGHSALR